MMRRIFIFIINLYQKTFSPDHGWLRGLYPGGYCKYSPSCSQYAKDAIMKYGIVRGAGKGIYRVIRCNPWSKGGIDQA
jgi:uncharacterized protein